MYSYAEYAQAWYEDALREARTGPRGDRQARRREIVFAVCCAESYLYEWAFARVRATSSADDLYANIQQHLSEATLARPLHERWLEITKSLHAAGLLPHKPNLRSSNHGKRWTRLIELRNHLVHAAISRPVFGSGPVPDPRYTNADLVKLEPGWAVTVVAERIRRLHQAAGTPPPEWLVAP